MILPMNYDVRFISVYLILPIDMGNLQVQKAILKVTFQYVHLRMATG